MKLFHIVLLVFLNILWMVSDGLAQSNANNLTAPDTAQIKSVTMAAGPRFAASRWKQFWWGKHWRQEWLMPVSFPILDLDTTAGGLTAIKRGGGHETKTLRLQGNDGKEYVLRTVEKSLDVLIPEEFKGSFVNDLVNDQISTAHPFGPLVVANLSGSIGILHTNPVIAFIPDNKRLAAFKNDFVNKLCLFEERTSGDGWEHTVQTRFADDIVNSEKLFIKLRETNDRPVDQAAYLKVRLFDMLINDWDRHEDQWVWASHKENGKTRYQAFARDRDQSFSKTDGVALFFLSLPWAVRSIQNLHPNLPDVIGSNLAATSLDKQLTNALTESNWKDEIDSLQHLLTDSAISKALHQMPASIYAISGDFLYKRLRQRRDNMMNFGMRYYKVLNKVVMITGSDKPELFTIHKSDDHTTEITIQSLTKKNQARDTLYHRIFQHKITKSINLYGLGGNDEFIYSGRTNNRILIRTFGNEGADTFSDSLDHNVKMAKLAAYDTPADAPAANQAFHFHATPDTAITNYNSKAFKYDWWMPLLVPGYNPDDGVIIGAGITYKKQQWHKDPFGWQQTFGGNYAAATGAFSLYYKGIFKQVIGKWDFNLTANYKAPSFVVNFYGFGNDSRLIVKDKAFYRVRATSFYFNPEVGRSWKYHTFSTGLLFNSVKVESADNKFVNQAIPRVDSSVFLTRYFGGANISYTYNTSNKPKYPTRGISYHAGSAYLINLKDGSKNFVNLQSSFTFYYSPIKSVTLAHRTGASTNIGDFEFYQANTLGGMTNLRGYWRTRFTGRSSFYQNTDIRWKLADLRGYVLRGSLGIYGFFDDGRVWFKDDQSNVLHTGYGGGVFFIPYSTLAINLSYASSKEINVFTFRTGFLF